VGTCCAGSWLELQPLLLLLLLLRMASPIVTAPTAMTMSSLTALVAEAAGSLGVRVCARVGAAMTVLVVDPGSGLPASRREGGSAAGAVHLRWNTCLSDMVWWVMTEWQVMSPVCCTWSLLCCGLTRRQHPCCQPTLATPLLPRAHCCYAPAANLQLVTCTQRLLNQQLVHYDRLGHTRHMQPNRCSGVRGNKCAHGVHARHSDSMRGGAPFPVLRRSTLDMHVMMLQADALQPTQGRTRRW
jgi:hypothetical protein